MTMFSSVDSHSKSLWTMVQPSPVIFQPSRLISRPPIAAAGQADDGQHQAGRGDDEQ
ncbi:hypothetical protein [Brevundimonas denitrificans]|uniref:hypothetical protein n=1 Tax=Brevundimonas denitrificans TaxID=1443434 RepID=UPI00223BB4F0|nr:hypothetical protein [Brevundimonas denitrificans]